MNVLASSDQFGVCS